MPTEFELIERFLRPFPRTAPGVPIGPGDDCAVVRPRPGADLCITTDAVVDGVHFDERFRDEEIGHKALAVNLSDIAAMGARPAWFVCSMALPASALDRLAGIARGMAALAREAAVTLAGGNFTRADTLSIHITVGGEVARGRALRRDGAKPGDVVFVTGTLGDAALALERGGDRAPRSLWARQSRPQPRLRAGALALEFAHAAIDISDGLLQDLGHVAASSGVGMEVDAERLPLSRQFRRAGGPLSLALSGGEDYELALAVPARRAAALEAAFARAGEPITRVGRVLRGSKVAVLNAPEPERAGHDHFAD